MAASLTANAILDMNSGGVDLHPNVQVLDVRQIGTGQSVQERYRLVLSDGIYFQQAMLATQLNNLVKSGDVQKGSIVKLIQYICNIVQQRKIIIVLNMGVVLSVSDIIGEPKHAIMSDQQKPSTPPLLQQENPHSCALPVNSVDGKENMVSWHSAASVPIPTGHQAQQGFESSTGSRIPKHNLSSTYGKPSGASSHQQPSPMYQLEGPIVKNEVFSRIVPISDLNPFLCRWTIKARVTAKADLRRYSNSKGEGKAFHFDLLDADGGEIRVTCFNSVADQFYDFIELGMVYLISKGLLKPAEQTFNHLKHEWEIYLEHSSSVEKCPEEGVSFPQLQFAFRSIREIANTEANARVDVIGVVVAVSPTITIMCKNGTETQKRSIQLCDTSGCSVELTLWGAFCNNEGQQVHKFSQSGHAGRVSDFNGTSIGTISSSQLLVNPNLPQAFEVKKWFEQLGKNAVPQSISKDGSVGTRVNMRKTISQIKDEGLGQYNKPDWIILKATISFLKSDSFCYTACPLPIGDRQCNKKVTNNGDGTWRCERCERAIAECDYRYILAVQVQDHTGITWVTAFQEAGEELIGVSAKQLHMQKQDENSKYEDYFQRLLFSPYLFKLKVKEENYNDEQRLKCTIVKSDKIDHVVESKVLIELIENLPREELGSVMIGGPSSSAVNVRVTGYNRYEDSNSCYKCGQGEHWARECPSQGVGVSIGNSSSCYTCGQDGHSARECPFQCAGGSIGNSNSCSKCGQGVHLASECPSQGAGGSIWNSSSCYKCGQGGHWASECLSQVARGSIGNSSSCYKCGQHGHWARECPSHGAGGSIGNSNTCYKCGQGGHWARECPSQGAGGYGRSSASFGKR